jgi:hypothetical protein
MPILANARYERFAQIVVDGQLTPTAAYRETLGAAARDPDVNSGRRMKKPQIAARIPELKAAASERCGLSRKRYMQPPSVFPPVKAFYARRVIDSRKRGGKRFCAQ